MMMNMMTTGDDDDDDDDGDDDDSEGDDDDDDADLSYLFPLSPTEKVRLGTMENARGAAQQTNHTTSHNTSHIQKPQTP